MTTIINGNPAVDVEIVKESPVLLTQSGGVGPPGPKGDTGNPGVFVGPTPPSDTSLLWVDTSVS